MHALKVVIACGAEGRNELKDAHTNIMLYLKVFAFRLYGGI